MGFHVKWQSSVTPRFLTEPDTGTNALPTVIEAMKEKEILGLSPRGYEHYFSLVVI